MKQLNRDEWQPFFDGISKSIEGLRVRIEVAGLDVGDQIGADWVPVTGISYDPKDDLVMLAMPEMEHIVYSPRQIHVEQDPSGNLQSVTVMDGQDRTQFIRFADPLALPDA